MKIRGVGNSCKGFSLSEVALAMGLCSVALASIIGVLGVSMKTSVEASTDTALGTMTQQIISEMRSLPFDSLGSELMDPTDASEVLSEQTEDSYFYFTTDGEQVDWMGGEPPMTVAYECRVRKKVDLESQSKDGSFNLVKLELLFSWPVSSQIEPEKRLGKIYTYASVARN